MRKKIVFSSLGSFSLVSILTVVACNQSHVTIINAEEILLDIDKVDFKSVIGKKIEPMQVYVSADPRIPTNYLLYSKDEKEWFTNLDLLGNSNVSKDHFFIKFNDTLTGFKILNNKVLRKDIYADASEVDISLTQINWQNGRYSMGNALSTEITDNWNVEFKLPNDDVWQNSIEKLGPKMEDNYANRLVQVKLTSRIMKKTFNGEKSILSRKLD